MKWLYISCVIVGAILPTVLVYVSNLSHAVPGLMVDLGLLFFSLGMGLLFAPIGVGVGLLIAAMIHGIWAITSRWARSSNNRVGDRYGE